jgi:hypothetical protein
VSEVSQLTWTGSMSVAPRICGGDFADHVPVVEAHPGLQEWLRETKDAEVWFTTTTDLLSRDLERTLIRTLQPRLNRIRYHTEMKGMNGYE